MNRKMQSIYDALNEARLCITDQDDIERDLGGNNKEMRAKFQRVIDIIDSAMETCKW